MMPDTEAYLDVLRGRDGNKDRICEVQWAIEHCGRLIRSIIVVTANPEGIPRKAMSRQAYRRSSCESRGRT
ncbi:MAG: hypothetical protein A3H25_13795 [Sphingomonadales bacterium RIFCSPLOWO2_12_FULL_63_15]|nr:MAG: hypothetical protein A3H25_13795 [Sphingomonadales bacterium RIFCSPLOWO2_12_FULL_63_15]